MKKLSAVCLSVIMLLALCVPAFAYSDKAQSSLSFNENGEFKIAVIADAQDGSPFSEIYQAYVNEMLDKEQPDLVIFLGDNITKNAGSMDSYDELLNPLVDRNIPFTFVFGNHDDECSPFTKEEMLANYQSYAGCLAYDADPSLHGCATHNLPIMASDGSKVAFNLWMFDSGDYALDENGNRRCYDCVRKDQVEWYKTVSTRLEEANGGKVPSLAFQHIIAQEPTQVAFLPCAVNPGGYNFSDGSKTSFLPNLGKIEGILMEKCCPSDDNEGQWDAMAERKDVLAVATGHDHVNDFVIKDVKGIDALQITGCTFNSYGKDYLRGAKIITLNENDLWSYDAQTAFIYDYALEEDSKIPMSKFSAFFAKLMYGFLRGIMKFFNIFG